VPPVPVALHPPLVSSCHGPFIARIIASTLHEYLRIGREFVCHGTQQQKKTNLGDVVHVGVDYCLPMVAALFLRAAGQLLRNTSPVLVAVLVHQSQERSTFLPTDQNIMIFVNIHI